MVDSIYTYYNPYRYQNFGYLRNNTSNIGISLELPNTTSETNLNSQSNTLQQSNINFSANTKISDEKKGLSSSTKFLLVTGTLLFTALTGAACLYNKGGGRASRKGVPETIKDGWNKLFQNKKNNLLSSTAERTNTTAKTVDTKEQIIETINFEKLTGKKSEPLKQYNSLQEGIADFKQNIKNGDFESGRDAEILLKELVPHNYKGDKSYIEINTRTRDVDFTRQTFDVENNNIYQYGLTPRGTTREFKTPDFIGSYLIRTLNDGRRIVGISVPAGRCDGANANGRPIRTVINIISKNQEFTPLQKDLIEIISKRQNMQYRPIDTDILSLGTLCRKESRLEAYRQGFKPYIINQEVLLSSIKTAKEQAKESVDKTFIQKALTLKPGEQIEHVEF